MTDSLKKREEFAISLRKKKKDEIIQAKRRQLMDFGSSNAPPCSPAEPPELDSYKICPFILTEGYHSQTVKTHNATVNLKEVLQEIVPVFFNEEYFRHLDETAQVVSAFW